MKKTFLTIFISVFTFCIHLTGCSRSPKKLEIHESKIMKVSVEFDSAETQYLLDMKRYRGTVEKKIRNNQRIIIVANSQLARTSDWQRASDLLTKNFSLEKRLRDYHGEGKADWELFKTDFNSDLVELDKALNDF